MTCINSSLPVWYLDRINFTLTANDKITQPRGWERKPSIPYIPRLKSRKLWKRFRTSFRSMQTQRAQIRGDSLVEVELSTEINNSANATFRRGVKRLCLSLPGSDICSPLDRSFLETKWEVDSRQKNRKQARAVGVVNHRFEDQKRLLNEETKCVRDGSSLTLGHEESPGLDNDQQPFQTSRSPSENKCEDEALSPNLSRWKISEPGKSGGTGNFKDKMEPQDALFVHSALRMNSLDPEEAAFLSEFLSRAQAKRAANAAMIPKANDQVPIVEVTANSTPRRALEEIDKNSPTPQLVAQSTLFQSDILLEVPKPPLVKEVQTAPESGDENQPSPTRYRRSARTKVQKSKQYSVRSVAPNQIPVETVKGTHVLFVQRTPAQELALTTRRNTQRNKGKAQPPRQVLVSLAKQQQTEDGQAAEPEAENENDLAVSPRRSPRKKASTKQVKWKDVVEYSDTKDQSKKPKKLAIASQGKNNTAISGEPNNDESSTDHIPSTPVPQARRILLKSTSSSLPSTVSGNATEIPSLLATGKAKPVSTPVSRKKLGLFVNSEPAKQPRSHSKTGIKSDIKLLNGSTATSTTKNSSRIPKSTARGSTPINKAASATPMAKRVQVNKSA